MWMTTVAMLRCSNNPTVHLIKEIDHRDEDQRLVWLERDVRESIRFTNARTATRSLDLPLAIGDPHLIPSPILCPSVDSGQCTAATTAGFLQRLPPAPIA
jgi:hypothetical protein